MKPAKETRLCKTTLFSPQPAEGAAVARISQTVCPSQLKASRDSVAVVRRQELRRFLRAKWDGDGKNCTSRLSRHRCWTLQTRWGWNGPGGLMPPPPLRLAVNVRRAVCVAGFHSASGREGERSPHHKETAPVQDWQEVTSRPKPLKRQCSFRSHRAKVFKYLWRVWVVNVYSFSIFFIFYFPSLFVKNKWLWQHTSSNFLSWRLSEVSEIKILS